MELLLHKIDTTLKKQSSKDLQMIYIMIFSSIFSFSYLLFWDSSFEKFQNKQIEIETLKTKINLDTIFVNVNPIQKVLLLENDIKNIKKEISIYKDYNSYIKNKIEAISSLIYNEVVWGEYLYSISDNAKKYNITLLQFSNKFANKQNSFGHILDISLRSEGNYKNTIKFINSLEESNLVVDIHSLEIKAQDKLYTDLNLSVWGITY